MLDPNASLGLYQEYGYIKLFAVPPVGLVNVLLQYPTMIEAQWHQQESQGAQLKQKIINQYIYYYYFTVNYIE